MRQVESYVRIAVCSIFVLFCCLGCTTPGTVGTGVKPETQQEMAQKAPEPPAPIAAATPKSDRVLSVAIEDGINETSVKIKGNGKFEGYQFQRLGQGKFALELAAINKDAPRPALPAPSKTLKLKYANGKSPNSLQLVGTLKGPLDHYVMDSVGNELVLRLYAAKASLPIVQPPPAAVADPVPPAAMPTPAKMKRYAPPPAAQVNPGMEMLPGANLQKSFKGKPISLDLLDADLKNVLRLLADVSGTNMVIEPDVVGRVTLKVDQVPWDQVLDMVLTMNNLGQEKVGNVIRIATQTKLTQEWKDQEEDIKARQKLMETAKDFGEVTTEYLTVNYAQPGEIASKINEIKSEKGKLSVDERTSLIIYSDYPSRIASARELLSKLDKATPQVMIEARIVQLTTTATRNLGIDWQFDFVHSSGGSNFNTDFQVNHPVGGDLFGFSFGEITGNTLWNIDLRLSALETAGEGRIISAPRVMTVNNVKAVITQGTQIPYAKLNEFGVTSTEFKDAVLELQVTPHITPDRKIRLEIAAKKEQPDFANAVGGVPAIDSRKINTELMVADGNTVVIGGVIEDDQNITTEGTPGLNRVPILGRLFKSERMRADKRELLIFINPRIIDSPMAAAHGR